VAVVVVVVVEEDEPLEPNTDPKTDDNAFERAPVADPKAPVSAEADIETPPPRLTDPEREVLEPETRTPPIPIVPETDPLDPTETEPNDPEVDTFTPPVVDPETLTPPTLTDPETVPLDPTATVPRGVEIDAVPMTLPAAAEMDPATEDTAEPRVENTDGEADAAGVMDEVDGEEYRAFLKVMPPIIVSDAEYDGVELRTEPVRLGVDPKADDSGDTAESAAYETADPTEDTDESNALRGVPYTDDID
jgi:hypothetical protein